MAVPSNALNKAAFAHVAMTRSEAESVGNCPVSRKTILSPRESDPRESVKGGAELIS